MGLDVVLSLFVYTFSTVAFFLLGAGVLHGFETIPQGADTIRSLSRIVWRPLIFGSLRWAS